MTVEYCVPQVRKTLDISVWCFFLLCWRYFCQYLVLAFLPDGFAMTFNCNTTVADYCYWTWETAKERNVQYDWLSGDDMMLVWRVFFHGKWLTMSCPGFPFQVPLDEHAKCLRSRCNVDVSTGRLMTINPADLSSCICSLPSHSIHPICASWHPFGLNSVGNWRRQFRSAYMACQGYTKRLKPVSAPKVIKSSLDMEWTVAKC